MKRTARAAAAALALLAAGLAEPADRQWRALSAEQVEVLKLTASVERGKDAYRQCSGCHRADGMGRIDGIYPRLAGQHASVIIKQVTDVRSGLRMNPKMKPFAEDHALTLQELRDVAEYLAGLVPVRENGKGSGADVGWGKVLYQRHRCGKCHGDRGEGDDARFYPVIAAQHYEYLEREMRMIKKGRRGNSHPDMVKAVKTMTDDELEAIADYLSSLPDYRTVVTKEAK